MEEYVYEDIHKTIKEVEWVPTVP